MDVLQVCVHLTCGRVYPQITEREAAACSSGSGILSIKPDDTTRISGFCDTINPVVLRSVVRYLQLHAVSPKANLVFSLFRSLLAHAY